MTTPDEYQQFAEECLRWARDAKTDADRKTFLDMARIWTKAAGGNAPDVMVQPRGEEPSHYAHSDCGRIPGRKRPGPEPVLLGQGRPSSWVTPRSWCGNYVRGQTLISVKWPDFSG